MEHYGTPVPFIALSDSNLIESNGKGFRSVPFHRNNHTTAGMYGPPDARKAHKTMTYGTAYITGLRRLTAERQALRAAEAAAAISDPRAVLRANLLAWQNTLTPEAAAAGFHLEDIRKAVPATPQQLGLALAELNWRRTRVWRSDGPYRRRWYPLDQ